MVLNTLYTYIHCVYAFKYVTAFFVFNSGYLHGELEELNDEYMTSILGILNPENPNDHIDFWKETHNADSDTMKENADLIKDIFRWSNAAAANLRFGDGSTNSGIGENFDPMGNEAGQMTGKESRIGQNYDVESSSDEFDGQHYMRSSTGLLQGDDPSEWYIKCFNNNNICF